MKQKLLALALLGLFLPPRSSGANITFSSNATLVACPTDLSTPAQVASFTSGSFLVSPTSQEGHLCILSRVNRNDTSKKVYIPIARSYDGNDWHRVEGRYISFVDTQCGTSAIHGVGYSAGDYLCEIFVPKLEPDNVGYFLTKWEDNSVTSRREAARFLEKATWGPRWSEIISLENSIATSGKKALALWVKNQQSLTPTSHRAFFRQRLNPRTVESYLYGVPGPMACKENARFRRFAFTYKDLELSRGNSGHWAGNSGLPFTPVEIKTIAIDGVNHYSVKFGGEIRTILPMPLTYKDSNNVNVTLSDGKYTICHVEEVVGDKIGNVTYNSVQFQLLVGALCTSSYTNAGGVADGKGDGSITAKVGTTLVRIYDKNACDTKCGDATKVKLIQGGNPEVMIPDSFDKTGLSWIDLSTLDTNSEIININTERTHDSSWLLTKDLNTCTDQNGNEFPDPARLAYTDYFSYGHGKYNLDKPIFAKLPGVNKWALHDFRTQFKGNTPESPLEDGGGAAMKAAARSGNNEDGNPNTDLVVRCSNVQRNVFNEGQCRISYHPDACQSVPLPDPKDFYRSNMYDPGAVVEAVWKYLPSYAGPDNGGVIVCGSENEVAPIPTEDDHFDVTNRKVQPGPIDYGGQKITVWVEVVLAAKDQLCQRLSFGLSKIFATSTSTNPDSFNSETNIGVYDNFVTSCFSTYKDVMKKVSFNQEMSEQLTFKFSKSVAADWHKSGTLAWPDENYARENLQLHSIGLLKLNDDGTPVLDRFGKRVANYEQKHIFSAAKIWTSFTESFRRGNYEDLDWASISYLDPLRIRDVSERDWFPKISTNGGYIGDKYPLCADLPERHFLKKGATFRLLGGSSVTLSHNDPLDWEGNSEVQRMSLHPGSQLFNALCNPTNASLPLSTLTSGTGLAEYYETFKAPFCRGTNETCDSGALLLGRASEQNSPNTLDGCSDGQDRTTTYTESVSRIIVTSVNGQELRGGDAVKVKATVISRSKQDRIDFYYASDASSPVWTFVTSVAPRAATPPSEIGVTLPYTSFPDITYTLPKCMSTSGCKQAVRVVSRSSRMQSNPTTTTARTDAYLKPNSNCPNAPYDDIDDVAFEVLPSPRPKDTCAFETIVTLDRNLQCEGQECAVSTVRVVEVMAGVFYEYIHLPCVHLPFYSDAVKVFAGWGNYIYMCADKKLPSARSTCCGSYTDRDLSISHWADVLSEYRGERLTYKGNTERCAAWGRTVCDPQRIGQFTSAGGHCLHHQSCVDVRSSDTVLTNSAWQWTTATCLIQVKVNADGLIAILHRPQDKWTRWGSQTFPEVQSHVHENKTVSYFHVHWDTTNVPVGKLEYPQVTDNGCDGGTISGEFCVCSTSVTTHAVFDSAPTKERILSDLFVGAFDPVMFEENEYTALIETDSDYGVSVYKRAGYSDYSEHTIFRIKDDSSNNYIFLKNVHSKVVVCNGTFFFRNSPTFYDIADPQLVSAYHEIDAYLDYVDRHDSTPPFVCKTLSKHFGNSNPSPQHVLGCSNAYKNGVFTWTNPVDSADTILFGSGKRGDLMAVSASILLSNDALSATLDSDPSFGGLKEPLHKLMHLMRSLEFNRSLSHRRTDTLISLSAQDILGQSPYGAPDQFSFFSPDYSPAGAHVESSLVSPEAELLNMKYVIGSQNAFYTLLQDGLTICWGGIGPSWNGGKGSCNGNSEAAGYLSFVPEGDISSSSNVVSQLSTLLTADRLDASSRNVIQSAYSAALASKGEAAALKVAQALLVSTPVFHASNNAVPENVERGSTQPHGHDEDEPYKAIIHLNLFGGMDSMNLLVPHPDGCASLYDEYRTERGENLYLKVDELIKVNASTSEQPCSSFGINKYLGQGFANLYNEGEVIFIANAGHLQKPVTAGNFLAETKTQLFSHYTMKEESFKVDAFKQRDDTGVLGRMTDILGNSMSTSRISIDRSSNNLVGDPTIGLKVDVMGSRGPDRFYSRDIYGIKQIIHELNNVTAETSSIHADLWSQSFIDAEKKSDSYLSMLQNVPQSNVIANTGLGRQIQMILKLIKLHAVREVNRDTFALTIDGFDTHFDLKNVLSQKFAEIGPALKGFRDELVTLGLWNSITIVISSEMGRTITPNTSAGTDHGWGGHHIVMGGNLKGGKILGHHPDTYNSNWMYNTGRGVWIPTTPNEAMWYGIAQWFGLKSDIALSYALPNMNNFGCRLYSETDLYRDGTGKVLGCGGDVMTFSQHFFLSEPRLMNPEEQKSFCAKVNDAIDGISIRCVILDQIIASRDPNVFQRSLNELGYTLGVTYEISSDSAGVFTLINDVVNSDVFKTAAAIEFDMTVSIQSAQVLTTPTQSPTRAPTLSPTHPTASPTTSPTNSPSKRPTVSPSESPSVSPSNSPTRFPSASPSMSPSVTPSKSPSRSPFVSPSKSPSVSPSDSPTRLPSVSPSMSPLATPSRPPSKSPMMSPSKSPSASPSRSPLKSPSTSPSTLPSAPPSALPSRSPIVFPTKSPSVSPSHSPTSFPSVSPSISPLANPSKSPSRSPIVSPSKSPSVSPSDSPTTLPSVSPIIPQFGNPSMSPSRSPIVLTSKSPSVYPSKSPTRFPSTLPSTSSSATPSKSPASSSIELPTKSPSVSPSKSPVRFPSMSPSTFPSNTPSKLPSRGPVTSPSKSPVSPSMSPTPGSCVTSKIRLQSTTGQQIQMFELQAYSLSGVNVAMQGSASQSSTYGDRQKFAADMAIDGNNSTFSHTTGSDAFWEVDLKGAVDIGKVLVLNRWCQSELDPKGCLCRLSYVTLTLLDQNDSIVAIKTFGNTCGLLAIEEPFASCTRPPTFPTTSPTGGFCSVNKIRLQSTTGKQIQMFELQAYSLSGVNVAMQGSASQSTTYANDQKFAAGMAIDGNNSTFSHTTGSDAFWEVDLKGAIDINKVLVLNRWCRSENDSKGCLCRLSYATLTLLDQNDSIVATETFGNTCGLLVVDQFFQCR